MDINAAGGSQAGISDDKIAALPDFRTSPPYSEPQRTALELAEAMTAANVHISDQSVEKRPLPRRVSVSAWSDVMNPSPGVWELMGCC